jgi:hypothetical protein
MEQNNIAQQIGNIMNERRNNMNQITEDTLGMENPMFPNDPGIVSDMRNDNDLDILERENLLNSSPGESNSYYNFDETYYLEDINNETDFMGPVMSANGELDEVLQEPRKEPSEILKNKALDLESRIVDRLARERYDDANRVFNVLERMHRKFDDDNVSDIYFRVLHSMPKESQPYQEVYSYRQDKNRFKDVLNQLNNNTEVKAFNEENPCINALGEMFEECDIDLCSDKCSDKILNAKKMSEKEECKNLVTGRENNSNIYIQDDIKDIILQRLRYCKKLAEMKKGNFEIVSHSEKLHLKNKVIEDIEKMAKLANNHYNSCYNNASEFLATDEKYKQILNILREIDYTKLSLERLETIRNDLALLPKCETLRYMEFDKSRNKDVKEGIRVGKYIIPKNTDYYNQIQGRDKPIVYKDVVSDKHYLYDGYTKTLTGMEHPVTKETLLNKDLSNEEYDLGPNDSDDAPAPSIILDELNLNNNLLKELGMLNSPSSSAPELKDENSGPVFSTKIGNDTNNKANKNNANKNNGNKNNANKNNANKNNANKNNANKNNANKNNSGVKLNGAEILQYVGLVVIILAILIIFGILI